MCGCWLRSEKPGHREGWCVTAIAESAALLVVGANLISSTVARRVAYLGSLAIFDSQESGVIGWHGL
jgi:hypothetical protein